MTTLLEIWHSHCFIFRPAVEAPSAQGCLEQASALASGTRRRVANRLHDHSIHRLALVARRSSLLVWSFLARSGLRSAPRTVIWSARPPAFPHPQSPNNGKVKAKNQKPNSSVLSIPFFQSPLSSASLLSSSTICFLRNSFNTTPRRQI